MSWENRVSSFFILVFFAVACTGAAPKRDFYVQLKFIDLKAGCLGYKKGKDIVVKCANELPVIDNPKSPFNGYLKGIVSIKVSDYIKERNFQSLQKRLCKEWKD